MMTGYNYRKTLSASTADEKLQMIEEHYKEADLLLIRSVLSHNIMNTHTHTRTRTHTHTRTRTRTHTHIHTHTPTVPTQKYQGVLFCSCGLWRLMLHQKVAKSSTKKTTNKLKVLWKKWQLQKQVSSHVPAKLNYKCPLLCTHHTETIRGRGRWLEGGLGHHMLPGEVCHYWLAVWD